MAISSAPIDTQPAASQRDSERTSQRMRSSNQRRQQQLGFRNVREKQFAHALGWLSIGLGIIEIIAPKRVGKLIGVGDHRGVIRLLGAREIASGIGILAQRKPAGWLWSRVGGDLMDLTLLGLAMKSQATQRGRAVGAAAAVVGVTALDLLCSQRVGRHPFAKERASLSSDPVHVQKSIGVNRSPKACYEFWRNVENLPRFMSRLESVKAIDHRHSRWIGRAKDGEAMQWDSEVSHDIPNHLIAWRANASEDVERIGSARFEPMIGGRGTLVKVDMTYKPKDLSTAIASELFGESHEEQLQEDLRRFKQLLETGEITRTQGQPSGKRSVVARVFSMWRER